MQLLTKTQYAVSVLVTQPDSMGTVMTEVPFPNIDLDPAYQAGPWKLVAASGINLIWERVIWDATKPYP